jgi:hypothetical protein
VGSDPQPHSRCESVVTIVASVVHFRSGDASPQWTVVAASSAYSCLPLAQPMCKSMSSRSSTKTAYLLPMAMHALVSWYMPIKSSCRVGGEPAHLVCWVNEKPAVDCGQPCSCNWRWTGKTTAVNNCTGLDDVLRRPRRSGYCGPVAPQETTPIEKALCGHS